MRLIDGNALKKKVIKGGIYYGTDLIKLIDNAPTIKACFTTKDLEEAYIRGKESGRNERLISCNTCIYNGDCERQRRLKERASIYCVHWVNEVKDE